MPPKKVLSCSFSFLDLYHKSLSSRAGCIDPIPSFNELIFPVLVSLCPLRVGEGNGLALLPLALILATCNLQLATTTKASKI